MKLTASRILLTLTASLILVLVACAKKSDQNSSGESAVESSMAASSSASFTQCDGVAPSGDLIPVRIESANSTRTDAGLYEGPVWIKDSLYFSDFTFSSGFPSRIQKLDASGNMTTVIEDSGSNGLAVDNQGNLIAGTHKFKALSRYNLATGERTTIVSEFNENVFNSPNDIAVAKDGTIYFTDPAFQRDAAPGGQEKTGVYRVTSDGNVSLVDDSIINPNGISLSVNEDVLYVNGGGEQGVLRAYPIVNGVPQAGKDLLTGISIPDGMAIDCQGNIYLTEHVKRKLTVYTPDGQPIAQASTDANLTNVAFGGADNKTLFMTGAGAVWKIDLNISGSAY
jgi:gluconolactonase